MSPLARYILFAALATVVNLGIQALALWLYQGPMALWLAMIAGTGSGFVLKYLLDKIFVFQYTAQNRAEEAKTVFLYGLMAVFTTLIFWGTEFLFHIAIQAEWGKYAGAIIGLTIGYIIKYYLDAKFVFKTQPAAKKSR
jgi:putative flippase GtrA